MVGTLLDAIEGSSKPSLSFEFYPPKDAAASTNLWSTVDNLLGASPAFTSVTYGAMGSNQDTSLSVVRKLAPMVPTIAHLTCIGAKRDVISQLLSDYSEAGVQGLLALRGDKPKGFDSLPQSDFSTALNLVDLAVGETSFTVGVAAFPEKHPESPSLEHDIKVLKLKQDAGAQFAMTQLFFEPDAYWRLIEKARLAGVTMPIIPGVMPISNVRQIIRMAEISGAAVPDSLRKRLDNAPTDESAQAIGMAFSVELGTQLLQSGAPGLHIFTLNQHVAALELAKAVGLA
jgi:methylenetetrahydrofolate reductase (NADPH)